MSFRLEVAQAVLPVALSTEDAPQRARVAQRSHAFRRADVQIEPPAGLPGRLDEFKDAAPAEPDRRADHGRGTEGGRPAEEEEQRDQPPHRGSRDDGRFALAARAEALVDAWLDRVDQET